VAEQKTKAKKGKYRKSQTTTKRRRGRDRVAWVIFFVILGGDKRNLHERRKSPLISWGGRSVGGGPGWGNRAQANNKVTNAHEIGHNSEGKKSRSSLKRDVGTRKNPLHKRGSGGTRNRTWARASTLSKTRHISKSGGGSQTSCEAISSKRNMQKLRKNAGKEPKKSVGSLPA